MDDHAAALYMDTKKDTDGTFFHVRLGTGQMRKLQAVANNNGESVSTLVKRIVFDFLNEDN